MIRTWKSVGVDMGMNDSTESATGNWTAEQSRYKELSLFG